MNICKVDFCTIVAVGAVLHGTLEIIYKFFTALWLHNTFMYL